MALSRSYGGGDFTEPRTCAAGVEALFCFFCQFAFLRMPAFLPGSQTPGSRQFLYQLVGFDNLLRRSDISESEQSGSK
jgi:hypothetical protein